MSVELEPNIIYSCHVITLCFQIKEIHLFHGCIIFPCDIFLYILLHNLSGSTQCDRGKPIFFSGEGVWTEYRSKELKIYWYPQFTTHSLELDLFPIIHGCLTDLVSDRLLYLTCNYFKRCGHIHRLLKMTLLDLSVWRETETHWQDSVRHFKGYRKCSGTSVAWQIGSIINAASAHWRVTDPGSVIAPL